MNVKDTGLADTCKVNDMDAVLTSLFGAKYSGRYMAQAQVAVPGKNNVWKQRNMQI